MSLSLALNAAVSGLSAASRSAQTISSNVANALTPGYAARETQLEGARLGGVRITDVTRRENPALLTDRRIADADMARGESRLSALERIVDAVGSAGDSDSIAGRLAAFESRLVEAAGQPASETRLLLLSQSGKALTGRVNAAGEEIQAARLDADSGIAASVERLQNGLNHIDALNDEIVRQRAIGSDVNALFDQRRQALDAIADIVPMREISRDHDRIALITTSGQLLLDDSAAELSFTETPGMAAGMALGAPLSGLQIDGRAIDMTDTAGKMSGGRLAALFDQRDRILPEAQQQLDAFALDLGTRLQADALDATTAAGAPGLLTDGGARIAAAPAAGLAQRLTFAAAADPDQGGEAWRLRDGLGAAAPGAEGDARLINAIGDALSGLGRLADELSGQADAEAFTAETELTFAMTRADTLREAELGLGVDTDDEMRRLLLVEQSYAANARVIEAAGQMIDRLMEI